MMWSHVAYEDILKELYIIQSCVINHMSFMCIQSIITRILRRFREVIHRFGEICTQHPLVLVDFSPLGELKCRAAENHATGGEKTSK